uniref:Glycoside hydrolase family 28 n=1 Tax=Extatosoma tiaratum TaxID=7024 RepID=A0A191XSY4_EXTTI|nr:glycoside hydrolase family 28 [Extatosoma tiaratum]
MLRQSSIIGITAAVILLLVRVGYSKDLRTVTEPKTPQNCTTLKATSGDDTKTIQNALDTCTKGKAVKLSSGTFYSGPLTIPSGISLLVDSGATLKALPDPSLYDMGEETCGTIDKYGVGCKPFITIRDASGSGIYGKGTIDGQGQKKMTGKTESWWQLANNANRSTVQNAPRLLQINNSADITLYQITLQNAPFYHVVSSRTNGLTVWGVTIYAPPSSRNTDGIDPSGYNITIAHCNISTGDDDVAIKAKIAPARHISVLNNHFGKGHGMSIGSEITYGVSDVTVSGLTLDGATYGLRIKSNSYRGGLVTGVTYTNVCMHNVQQPILLDTRYENYLTGNLTPQFHDVTFTNVKVLTAGTFTFNGFSDSKPVQATMEDVHIKKGSKWITKYAKITGTWAEDVTGTLCGYAGNE